TPLVYRRGTVKELVQANDCDIKIQGYLFGDYDSKAFPHAYYFTFDNLYFCLTFFCTIQFDDYKYVSVKKQYIRIESNTYPTEYFRKSDSFIEEIKKEGIV
ncbi:MAG: hypothetical protein LBG92_06025, partial [Prevotellaceae bacterium]|nr:hypothetical protein [Prevotellaceae bacterium]